MKTKGEYKMRTKEEVEKIIDSLDFDEIRRISIFESGKIWIYNDGSITHVTDGTIPNPVENTVIAILSCSGRGNVDESYYAEGWATQMDDGNYITDYGRILSPDEMIEECLASGDFSESDEKIREYIRQQIE